VKELLEAYLLNGEQTCGRHPRSRRGGDLAEIEQAAHALAGMAGETSASSASRRLATLLRQACKDGEADKITHLAIGFV